MSRLRLKTMKLPKYVHAWFDKRDSQTYYYLRRRGFSLVRLPGLPWSPSFMAAYEAALSGPRAAIGAGRTKPGSVSARRDDPTANIKLASIKGDGFHTWTEDEIAQFEAHHPIGSKPRLALALLLYTGQRRSDVVRMGRQHIRDGVLTSSSRRPVLSLQSRCIPTCVRCSMPRRAST